MKASAALLLTALSHALCAASGPAPARDLLQVDAVIAGSPGAFPALLDEPEDVYVAARATCFMGTNATFNVRKMNLGFRKVGVVSGSVDVSEPIRAFAGPIWDQMGGYLNAMESGNVYNQVSAAYNYYDYVQTLSSSMQTGSAAFAGYATMVLSVAYAIADICAQQNNQWNTYTFHVPVEGEYKITCALKGGWDKPRNRVVLQGNSERPIDWEEQLVSDRAKTWSLHLMPGPYYISVGLGGGSSVIFHTAGTLTSAQLDDWMTRTFTVPIVLESKTVDVDAAMPGFGATAAVSLRTPTQAEIDSLAFPDILDGSKPSFSPIQPLGIQVEPNVPYLYRKLLITDSGRCFIFHFSGAETLSAPVSTPTETTFTLVNRGEWTEQRCSNY